MTSSRRLACVSAVVAAAVAMVGPAAAREAPRHVAAPAAFSCSLKWSSSSVRSGSARSLLRITGSCAEGPYAAVLIQTPRNRIAPGGIARVDGAARCTQPSPRALRCTMRAATSHVGVRIALREAQARRPTVTFFDRAGRKMPWVSSGGPQSPLGASAPPPATAAFPQDPLQAEGRFTDGSGGCPVVTAFRANFVWRVQGSALRIDQLGTTHTVTGTIASAGTNTWSWQASTPSGNERYTNGVVTRNSGGGGFTATADYAFTTANGCTQTYKVTFVL